jgi:diguanylate cyclase (GGDEF)-like protein
VKVPDRGDLIVIDFDRFKLTNDTLGHEAGDELLRQISGRLRSALRAADTIGPDAIGNVVARFGGDEFLILINDLQSDADATVVAQRLLDALAPAYSIFGSELRSTASVGIVTSDQSQATAEDVLRNADVAMYRAKLGNIPFVFFDLSLDGDENQIRLVEDRRERAPQREPGGGREHDGEEHEAGGEPLRAARGAVPLHHRGDGGPPDDLRGGRFARRSQA